MLHEGTKSSTGLGGVPRVADGLNPRQTVRRILASPYQYQGLTPDEPVERLLERVGLRPEHADRHPHEFSGGQAQRIGIARALALRSKLVVCDSAQRLPLPHALPEG